MTDDDVLKAACCLAGTDSEVTVEELVLLKRLVTSAGLTFDALIVKASRDDDLRQNRIETARPLFRRGRAVLLCKALGGRRGSPGRRGSRRTGSRR